MRPYNEHEAVGAELLKVKKFPSFSKTKHSHKQHFYMFGIKEYAKGKERLKNDVYVCHYFFPDKMAIIITSKWVNVFFSFLLVKFISCNVLLFQLFVFNFTTRHVLLTKKETIIKNEWENVWFCHLKELKNEPKVNGTKLTFSTPVSIAFLIW